MKDFQDRRSKRRHQRLIRLAYQAGDAEMTCVTTDISLVGAFVTTHDVLPAGYHVDFRYSDEAGRPLVLRTRVVRVIAPSVRSNRMPGMALEFEQIVSPSGHAPLIAFLQSVLVADEGDLAEEKFTANEDTSVVYHVVRTAIAIGTGAAARHVHEERLNPERTVPEPNAAGEGLRRTLATGKERRKNPRYPTRVDVTWYVDEMPFSGAVLNIGLTSLFLHTDHELQAVGSHVVLHLPVGEAGDPARVTIEATVVRTWTPGAELLPGGALRFDRVDEHGLKGIFRRYIDRFARGPGKPRRGFHYGATKRR